MVVTSSRIRLIAAAAAATAAPQVVSRYGRRARRFRPRGVNDSKTAQNRRFTRTPGVTSLRVAPSVKRDGVKK